MKIGSKLSEPTVPTKTQEQQYASQNEVDQAVNALTDADFVKLLMIARSFCKKRGLTPSVMEPKELLSEAVIKTLQMEKKWRRGVLMVKHLDRAMENISGHLVRERKVILNFSDGLPPDHLAKDEEVAELSAEQALIAKERSEELLQKVFGDDEQARRVVWLRAEGFEPAQIIDKLDLDDQKYEAIARRIRRKIAKNLELHPVEHIL
jgi:DNA-directed RNA polymerase specialized sigma24 family protein